MRHGKRGGVFVQTDRKLDRLKEILAGMESALIAYSGGADSTLLLKVARDVLGERVVAATALSPTYPQVEMEHAKRTAALIGARHVTVATGELSDPAFAGNPLDRCYWCKRELFSELGRLAERSDLDYVLDGSNRDDVDDFRPGMKAAKEFGVRSPLREAGLGKEEIRRLSKKLGLQTWNKPALACLASRFPYGTAITEERLRVVDEAEGYLRSLGVTQVRVRHHDDVARIEVPEAEIGKIVRKKFMRKIVDRLKRLGYRHVTVDLAGYRTGSMNPVEEGSASRGRK